MTEPSDRICTDCPNQARPGGRQCARCYGRRYRATDNGRRRTIDANIAYNKRNPDKRREWARRSKERTGGRRRVDGVIYFTPPPELAVVRRAYKRLDQALSDAGRRAGLREATELGGNEGSER